jgi:glutaredoxin-like YruB-family protein
MADVIIYSTPTCVYCKKTKEYLSQHQIVFTDHDVAFDEARRNEMIELTGQMGVPVILIDKEITIGFDKPRLATLLNIVE